MPQLELRFLGPFQATLGAKPITAFESDKVRALLATLVVDADRAHPRDALAALLWPDRPDASARKNLRQALTNLRRTLADERADPSFLSITRDALQFNVASDHRLDVAEFDRLLKAAKAHRHRRLAGCPTCLESLRQAVALYRGDFLVAFHAGDCPEFEEWALLHREALRRRALDALFALAAAHLQRGEFEAARQYAHRQLELDAWREEAHRQVMVALAATGQRSAALARFEQCRNVLQAELGVEPDEETLALHDQIRANTFDPGVHAPPHNLPAETTSFVGREAELAQLSNHLSNPDCRLVTLVGPGGVGKSRLALEAARRVGFGFTDGVRFAPLADVDEPDQLATALAEGCDLRLAGRDDPQSQLFDFLRDKELLLLLDNFEHLLGGVETIAELLREAPAVTLLATSREALRLQSEWIIETRGLPYPQDDSAIVTADRFGSVRLFCERAQQSRTGFELSATNAPAVGRICRTVEGLPLALEMAAAWAPRRPLDEIVAEIEYNVDFLASRMRDAPARHRSMRAVFEHSWNLLAPREQAVFARLSVFRGSFSAIAAGQVCDAPTPMLNDLIEKSLLQRAGEARYSLHELLRQFGNEKLRADASALHDVRERHSCYYLRRLAEKESALNGAGQLQALADIVGDLDNVRAAWELAVDEMDRDSVESAIEPLFLFHEIQGRAMEGTELFKRAAERTRSATDLALAQLHHRLNARAGALLWRTGQYEEAEIRLAGTLDWMRTCDDKAEMAFALRKLGGIAVERGDFDRAEDQWRESLTLYREVGDQVGEAIALRSLATVLEMQGGREQAWQIHQASAAISRELGNLWNLAAVLSNMGITAYGMGDREHAAELFAESAEHQRALDDKRGLAIALMNLGETLTALGRTGEAHEHLMQALQASRASGARYLIALTLSALGANAVTLGNNPAAWDYFRDALEISVEVQSLPATLTQLADLGALLLHDEEWARAAELLTLVQRHPSAEQNAIDKAERVLEELSHVLPKDQYAEACRRGQQLELDEVVAELLNE